MDAPNLQLRSIHLAAATAEIVRSAEAFRVAVAAIELTMTGKMEQKKHIYPKFQLNFQSYIFFSSSVTRKHNSLEMPLMDFICQGEFR